MRTALRFLNSFSFGVNLAAVAVALAPAMILIWGPYDTPVAPWRVFGTGVAFAAASLTTLAATWLFHRNRSGS